MKKAITVEKVIANIDNRILAAIKDKHILKEELERETKENNILQINDYISDIKYSISKLRKDKAALKRLVKRYEIYKEGECEKG